MLLISGCAPLVYRINYRPIHGTVGYFMNAPFTSPCASAQIDTPAELQEGGLPPGIELQPDGKMEGTPQTAGRWHAMVSLPKYHCGTRAYAGEGMAVNFEILDRLSSSSNP